MGRKGTDFELKGLKIVATGKALPKHSLTNEDMSKLVDTNDEWIVTRTGIHSRFQCREESCLSLAVGAARNAMESGGIRPEQIGLVLVASQTADYAFPSTACLIQKELGLGEEVMAFDISAACTGFLFSLGTARGLLEALKKPYALLIGSEQLSRIIDYTDRGTCILFGDGAGAVIVEAAEKEFYQKSWSRGDIGALSCPGLGKEGQHIRMNGSEVFRFAVTAMQQGISEVLAEKGLTMDDIAHVVCHQANARIIGHVQKKFPGQEEKFFINIDHYGNTSAASIPLALDDLNKAGRLKPGQKIICVGFGAGLTWSSALLEL